MDNIDHLLRYSEPWLQYAIRLNIKGERKEELTALKTEALQSDKICSLLRDVAGFHSTLVSNHKNPELSVNKLLFLLDLGFDHTVPEIQFAVDEILMRMEDTGIYQSLINVPKHFGGSGEDTFGWCLCDAPLLLLALVKAGVDYEKHIKRGVVKLATLYRSNGFPCAVSSELGKFRGPGRKDDCCPFATLIMLKLFSELPEYKDSTLANETADALLKLWETSLQSHPYMFYMGTDFRKLKAPAVWYDIVSVTDVLSRFDHAKRDYRFSEMLSIIKAKQDGDGFFTSESIYTKMSGWDFAQRKVPSPYLTYLCLRIFQRAEVTA